MAGQYPKCPLGSHDIFVEIVSLGRWDTFLLSKMATNESTGDVRFHRKCGQLISLSSCGRTALRNYASQEFNHGLVMSNMPLQEDQLFEVRLDKKINSWSGSIEVVSNCKMVLPSSKMTLKRISTGCGCVWSRWLWDATAVKCYRNKKRSMGVVGKFYLKRWKIDSSNEDYVLCHLKLT